MVNGSLNATLNHSLTPSLNASLNVTNATVAKTGNLFVDLTTYYLPHLYHRFIELVTAPAEIPGMLWIVVPLVIALLLMEFYFSRYTREELGWNTAVGNSLVLIFVSIDLLRNIYGDQNFLAIDLGELVAVKKTLIALVIMGASFVLMFTEFFHMLPKRFAFFVSSTLPINLIAYLGIILVYSDIPLDGYTLIATIGLFVVLLLFFKLLKAIVPTAPDEADELPEPRYDYKPY